MFKKEKAIDVLDLVLFMAAFPGVVFIAAFLEAFSPDLLGEILSATEAKQRIFLVLIATIYLGGTALLFCFSN